MLVVTRAGRVRAWSQGELRLYPHYGIFLTECFLYHFGIILSRDTSAVSGV